LSNWRTKGGSAEGTGDGLLARKELGGKRGQLKVKDTGGGRPANENGAVGM